MDTKKIKKKNIFTVAALFVAMLFVISACISPAPTQPGDPVEQAMQTLQAQATQD